MKIEDIKSVIPPESAHLNSFDIEKWRIKNPMDYLKTMNLIIISANKDEVFRAIYDITRYYITDTLFKY